MDHGTNMGSGLFSVSKKHYLPETIRKIQREQKKTLVPILWQLCRLKENIFVFQKCEVQNQHSGNFSYKNIIWMWAREHLETHHKSSLYIKLQFKPSNESKE